MRNILVWFLALYYCLVASCRMHRIRKARLDDRIYTTKDGMEINVYPGTKSRWDFKVKFRRPGERRELTPAHVHIIVEMYVKHAYNPSLTLRLRDHILQMMRSIQPIDYFPPRLQFFRPEHVDPFRELDRVGEFTVEFLLVVTELLAIQEKTNYPKGSLTESLYEDFGVKDRFRVIQKAIFTNKRRG
ncbi:MAG: hypothetical protein ABDK93_06415 [Atribacterota bacterium]